MIRGLSEIVALALLCCLIIVVGAILFDLLR